MFVLEAFDPYGVDLVRGLTLLWENSEAVGGGANGNAPHVRAVQEWDQIDSHENVRRKMRSWHIAKILHCGCQEKRSGPDVL